MRNPELYLRWPIMQGVSMRKPHLAVDDGSAKGLVELTFDAGYEDFPGAPFRYQRDRMSPLRRADWTAGPCTLTPAGGERWMSMVPTTGRGYSRIETVS